MIGASSMDDLQNAMNSLGSIFQQPKKEHVQLKSS